MARGRGGHGSTGGARGGRRHGGKFPNKTGEKMVCGVHIRPSNVPAQEYIQVYGRPVEAETKYHRVLEEGEKRGDCICDYHDYPVLLKERQELSEEYKNFPKEKVFRFADLIPELRIKIYETALVPSDAIEFCPEPFYFNSKKLKWEPWVDDFEKSVAQNKAWMKERIYHFSRFMRVSKQIHMEASKVFYGQNEFRFSNGAGPTALDCFLYQIHLDKCALLRNISVCHPALSLIPRTLAMSQEFLDGICHISFEWEDKASLYHYARWFDYTKGEDATKVLQKAGKLQYLQYIMPAGRRAQLEPDLTSLCVDAALFEGLKLAVISLEDDRTNLENVVRMDDVVVSVMETSGVVQSAQLVGLGEFGRYPKVFKGKVWELKDGEDAEEGTEDGVKEVDT